MRISDWSSDVCSSDLPKNNGLRTKKQARKHCARHVFAVTNPLTFTTFGPTPPGTNGFSTFDARNTARRKSFPSHFERSEERRVGKECVSKCRSRWSPDH